jgi:hypothetical protein
VGESAITLAGIILAERPIGDHIEIGAGAGRDAFAAPISSELYFAIAKAPSERDRNSVSATPPAFALRTIRRARR